MNRIFVMQ